ncbi:ornithine cyclodeaminase family protein [Spongiimicrobium salis]|uniref:ornithine cyclodeaminase family protein n=1 Tax=Spongiimicrobium salis TaxID=1667022 RepID=UPI00374DA42F
MDDMVQIGADFIEEHTDFEVLIQALRSGFSSKELLVPMRHHHDFPNPEVNADSTLLVMPAWIPGKVSGVKIVTVNPENGQFNLPSIQGTYIYFDALKGTIKAVLDAKSLTAKRTAATSALASYFLSKKEASSLLMIGTGALSINLIKAHASVRPIKQVYLWGRNHEKAIALSNQLKNESFECIPIRTIADKINEVDIVSSATLSKTPLILGKYLKAGQHIDLVGAYKKEMREADDETIKKASVFVDTYEGGMQESGDIVIPVQNGILREEDIKADLFELCTAEKKGRSNTAEITVFKSVGYALEDLVAASYYYNQYCHGENISEY